MLFCAPDDDGAPSSAGHQLFEGPRTNRLTPRPDFESRRRIGFDSRRLGSGNCLPDYSPPDWLCDCGLPGGRRRGERGIVAQQVGQLVAERVDPILEPFVEHVADHDHAALRPLAHAAEVGVAELSLSALAGGERQHQRRNGVRADIVAASHVVDDPAPFGGEILHGGGILDHACGGLPAGVVQCNSTSASEQTGKAASRHG